MTSYLRLRVCKRLGTTCIHIATCDRCVLIIYCIICVCMTSYFLGTRRHFKRLIILTDCLIVYVTYATYVVYSILTRRTPFSTPLNTPHPLYRLYNGLDWWLSKSHYIVFEVSVYNLTTPIMVINRSPIINS